MLAELELHIHLIIHYVNKVQGFQAFGEQELQNEACTLCDHSLWIIAEAQSRFQDNIIDKCFVREQGMASWKMTQEIRSTESDKSPGALQAAEEEHQQRF